ncbi:hypothetical protein CK203_092097 [Vitis vinifera]|uniref:Reverse transcriptase Ty1/copia-type domain-containing protein n=1 Tax=Vitis vinifera TaxID=29760 RepID=A0A438ECJ8_VITVI|nr:hypothetical protein CK203_092097 [Vitis vinifera]
MHSEFEMSMMGELNFFLGLQIKQLKEGTFINQAKYIKDLLKRFNMEEAKVMKTPMSSSIKLDIDEKDADFAGCRVERKSTSGTCHFLGHSLVSWHSKKQNLVALSTAETEYIAAGLFSSIFKGLGFRVCGCIFISAFILYLDSFFTSFASLMAPRRETGTSRAQGKRPVKPSQPEQTEACRKARFDMALFSSNEDYQRYKQKFAQRKVVLGRSVNFSQLQHFGFEGLFGRMGWLPIVMISEPIFPTLVRAFYSRATYGLGGPAKAWPTVPGFEPREVVQRLCGLADPQGMGKPSAHSLTVTSRVLHHMICSILLPHGGHRDEVSYLEAFIVDSILTGRRIHVGYLMMMHMISCVESSTRVLPYDRFLTRSFKDAGVDLSRETDFEAPTTYDTYDEQSLGCMKFEKAPDGSWVRKAERQAREHDQMHPGAEEEVKIREMEDGLDPQRDFEQRGPKVDIPPPHQSEGIHVEATFSEPMMTESSFTAGPSSQPSFTELPSQAPHVHDHAPWMDFSAQISSLGTRMEEFAIVHDSRFYSIEEHLNQYQVGFTSQFEHLV